MLCMVQQYPIKYLSAVVQVLHRIKFKGIDLSLLQTIRQPLIHSVTIDNSNCNASVMVSGLIDANNRILHFC